MHENGQPVTAPTLLLTLLNLLQTPPERGFLLGVPRFSLLLEFLTRGVTGNRRSTAAQSVTRFILCRQTTSTKAKGNLPSGTTTRVRLSAGVYFVVNNGTGLHFVFVSLPSLLLEVNTTAIFPLLVTPLDNGSESAAQTLRLLEFSSSLETAVAGRSPLDCRHCSATRRRPPMLEDYCSTVDAAQPLAGACSSLSTLLSWDSFSLRRPPEVDAGKLFPEVHSSSALLATSCFTGGKLE
nr:hypothetical protein Iba_chr03cCG6830 [Ipomoea batatas]